jgi:hypothetical protein
MSFIKKAKDKLRELDDKHDEVVAKVHNFVNEDYKEMARDNAKYRLQEAQYERKSEEDDGSLIHFHPMRDLQEKKDRRFLELTGGNNEEVQREDPAVRAAEIEQWQNYLNSKRELDTSDAERRLRAKKGNW